MCMLRRTIGVGDLLPRDPMLPTRQQRGQLNVEKENKKRTMNKETNGQIDRCWDIFFSLCYRLNNFSSSLSFFSSSINKEKGQKD